MKVNMDTLPEKMKELRVDERGYPVPWFVDWIGGKPEFRAMDRNKWVLAIQHSLCWVCGTKLGVTKCFVAGPMCGVNRTSSEPPSHPECARWSAQNCPFLANPNMIRREDELINNQNTKDKTAGFAITRNPGVAMLWFTRSFEVFNDGRGRPLITFGNPTAVEWWREGRLASREEVDDSIYSGLPTLEAMARQEQGGIEVLRAYVKRLEKWLPKAS